MGNELKPFNDAVFLRGPQTIPGRVYCAYYDFGGEGIAYHDSDAINHGSGELNPVDGSYLHSFRIDEAVDTSYTKGNEMDNSSYNMVQPELGLLYVGWTEPGEWIKFTVYVQKTGLYAVHLLYTSNCGGEISISVNDQDATGPLQIISTFNSHDPLPWRQWHHWNRMSDLVHIRLDHGIQVITLHTLTNGNMNYAYLDFDYLTKRES
jgi:hypothetical protein